MSETGGGDAFSPRELVRSVMADHSNGVLTRMRRLLEDASWSDVQFLVGPEHSPGRTFRAHRLVLASASPALAALMYGPPSDPPPPSAEPQGPIHVPDLQPDTFRALLLYLYTDELSPGGVDEAMSYVRAAKKYLLPHMTSRCCKYLAGTLTSENVLAVLEFARDVGEPQLADRSLHFLCQHAETALRQPSFLAASPATLRLVLDQDGLRVTSEADVVDAVLRWSAEECRRRRLPALPATRRDVLGDELLGRLRLLTLSADEFVGVRGLREVLTPEEYRDVLSHLVRPGTCEELPSAICPNDARRGVASAGRDPGEEPALCAHCHSSLVTTYMGNFCAVCKKAAD